MRADGELGRMLCREEDIRSSVLPSRLVLMGRGLEVKVINDTLLSGLARERSLCTKCSELK